MDTDQEVLSRIHGVNHRAEISSELPMRQWVYAWLFDPHREGNLQRSIKHPAPAAPRGPRLHPHGQGERISAGLETDYPRESHA